MPTFASLLRTPVNRPKPKEKIRFSFVGSDGIQEEQEEEKEDVVSLPNPIDALNHLGGAFMRPRDDRVLEMDFATFDDIFGDLEGWLGLA